MDEILNLIIVLLAGMLGAVLLFLYLIGAVLVFVAQEIVRALQERSERKEATRR